MKKKRYISRIGMFKTFKYKLMLEAALVGLITGAFVVVFRLGVEKISSVTGFLYNHAFEKFIFIPLWGSILIFLALAVTFLVKKEPLISGSGIPQVEAELRGELETKWYRVLALKFIGCVLSLGAGLSLGREGPSVQLGAMTGKGFGKLLKKSRTETRFLMTCGAGAGLTAAFNAPLAGAVFCLEEMNKAFTEKTLLTAMAATISSDFVASYIFGLKPIFTLKVGAAMPLKYYYLIALLGLCLGIMGRVFTKALELFQNFFSQKKVKDVAPFAGFIFVFFLSLFYPLAVGGGTHLVEMAAAGKMALSALGVLFVIKFLFFLVCFGSRAPGGIFMPMLVFGAVLGSIFGTFTGEILGVGTIYVETFVIAGMAGYFAAIVRSPVTGIVLISEMTGSLSHLLPLALCSLCAYFAADLCGSRPVYDQLRQRLIH